MWQALTLSVKKLGSLALQSTEELTFGEIKMKLIYTAIFLFTLGACGATIDKHDEHLKEVQREQEIYKGFANMQNSIELNARELKTKRENEAQYNAMIERINDGDDGVIYE